MDKSSNQSIDITNLEAQIVRNTESAGLVHSQNDNLCSDQLFAKLFISISVTALLCPFAICDVYYASADDTCLTQSQSSHGLTIILQSYLMASGILMFLFIGAFNVGIFVCGVNMLQTQDDTNDAMYCVKYFEYVYHLFDLPWLILGCVLFWEYTDMSACSQSIHDYLFARFIIGIISTVGRIQRMNSSS
jgi:hypothetical protein